MAKRGQYFTRYAQKLNLTSAELDVHLISRADSDADHKALLNQNGAQLSLFADAA